MRPDQPRQLLAQGLAELAEARRHLDYSFVRVTNLPESLRRASEPELESVEAFSSRFARAVDLLVNKVLRSLDRFELKSAGTLLDVVNRAEQRGFVTSADDLREMKDVRNVIAHDYAGIRTEEIFAYCRKQKPIFDAICERVADYSQRIMKAE